MLSFHIHSNYSLLEGTIRIEDLISYAKKNGDGYVALTDTNGMHGLSRRLREHLQHQVIMLLSIIQAV